MKRILIVVTLASCARPNQPQATPAPAQQETLPAAAFLAALPDGEYKRQFIIDCTGCHQFREGIAYPGGAPRTEEAWLAAITRMVSSYGPQSGFPVIGHARHAAETARWLASAVPARNRITWNLPAEAAAKADIREYPLPNEGDLPHDLAVAGNRVIVTGMFTAQMYSVDMTSGAVTTEPTPRPNPRAIEIGADGTWWVVLGAPRALARRTPDGQWSVFDAGYYAHSVALGPEGGAWVNGHFTHQPELISRVDAATGARRDFTVPAHPTMPVTPVPYEIRVARDGIVWMSELQGNRIIRFDPASSEFRTWPMPTSASGPRRFDVDSAGVLWIPAYGANRLVKFDPRTQQFTEYELPMKDAAPYIARVDERRNAIWIGTGMADLLVRFDRATHRFSYYRLPTGDALIRHLALDPATGDVWLAPGSSPGTTPARIVRVRPQD